MKNLALKLLAFQKEVGAIPKNEENPFFKSKYADINTYIEVVKPILSKHGLVLLQPLTGTSNSNQFGNALRTQIIDSESGEEISEWTPLPHNPDPQKMGAIITYFRRYAIQSMLCLQAEDTDGNETAQKSIQQESNLEQEAFEAFMGNPLEALNEEPFASKPKFTQKVVGARCNDCGEGKYVLNPKTQKVFCDRKCWTKK